MYLPIAIRSWQFSQGDIYKPQGRFATSSFRSNAGIYAELRLPESHVGFAEIRSQRPAADDLKLSLHFDLANNIGTESNAGPGATAKGQYDRGVGIS
jgi:hypothetical protein